MGTKLSEGLSEQQMGEFESFVDQAEDKVRAWFATNMSDYASRQDFVQLQQSAPEGTSELAVLREYGSLKWLELNRPDYRDVVAAELKALKTEIRANAPTILGEGESAQPRRWPPLIDLPFGAIQNSTSKVEFSLRAIQSSLSTGESTTFAV